MKTMRVSILTVATATLLFVFGCVMEPDGAIVFHPPVFVVPPPPAVVISTPEPAPVPDSYVWDGTEYVGCIGDSYFYLGPGNIWIACDGPRLERFHGWERQHGGWRGHAIKNVRFRNDGRDHGHSPPPRGRDDKEKHEPERRDSDRR